ncbi:VanW family protein [Raoultibacter phocaeensis]|uniref:VanW family protein n=1 Tax=Raoultibacter phocaeensis TaxID=2479841 RepID=UPI001118AF07|nr:VanW family protein [Raoultibacter phocaeensis]
MPGSHNPLGQTTLWTKEPNKNSGASGFAGALKTFFLTLGGIAAMVFSALGRFFGFLFHTIARSKAAVIAVAIVVFFGTAFGIDLAVNWGKVYPGVTVGEVDLSGKSVEEARDLLESTYAPRLANKEVLIFANEEASEDIEAALAKAENNALAEQQSVDEAKANKVLWTADAASLSATFDAEGLAFRALAVGREEGGVVARIDALLFGEHLKPTATFDWQAIDGLAEEIDAAIGQVRMNFDILVSDGVARITEGRDGNMVDREALEAELNDAFLSEAGERAVFVAHTEYAPIQISRDEAQRVCDLVNKTISEGATFSYKGTVWEASASDIGSWVKTRVVGEENAYALEPYLDQSIAKGIVINHLKSTFDGDAIKVTFEIAGDEQIVHTETDETIPVAGQAVSDLERALFDASSDSAQSGSAPIIEVGEKKVPDTMPLSEALENGVISSIATFTTEYTAEPSSRQHNIHLGADLLNNSIIKADGGTWSFNDTSGDYNEEAGFQGAGAILDDEFVDAIGGGICQVATTVFNAVYDSGFPVVTRHNHSLYIASYPAGRDAAVAYPDLDLVWKNDSPSDVLLAMSYTDTTVTATLYGVNPEYQVETSIGEWQEGEKFKTKTKVDENLAPGTSYVKTVGTDGRKISIVRMVKDKNGTILHEDLFSSTYSPINEVKIEGPPVKEQTGEEKNDQSESSAGQGGAESNGNA